MAALSVGPPSDDLAGILVDRVSACLDLDIAALYRGRGEGEALHLVAQRGLSPSVNPEVETIAMDKPFLVVRAARTREPQLVEDLSTLGPDRSPDPLLDQLAGCGAALALPLVFGGCLQGVLCARVAAPQVLCSAARGTLLTLARVIAIGLAESASRRAQGGLSQQLGQLQRSSQAVVGMMSLLPQQELVASVQRGFYRWPRQVTPLVPEFVADVLRRIVKEACALTGAAMGASGVGDDPNRPFDLWVTSGVSPEVASAINQIPRPVGTFGVVAIKGERVRTANVGAHPSFRGLPAGHPAVTSFLAVPIQYGDQAMGSLYLANKQGGDFTEDDLRTVEILSFQVGVAIHQGCLLSAIDTQSAMTQRLLDSAPHGIAFVDGETHRVTANPSAMRMFVGVGSPDDTLETYARQLRSWDGGPVSLEDLASVRALRGEECVSRQFIVVRGDGTQIPVSTSAAPVRTIGHRIVGAVVTFEDVSAAWELSRMHSSHRIREEFNAMVAHDLRNPVQAVLAQLYLLIGKNPAEEVTVPVKALRRIERSAMALARMTEKLIEAARVELERIDVQRKPTSVAKAVEDLLDRIRPAVQHPVDLSVEEGLPPIPLDVLAFEEILTNLIDNADTFSPPGSPIRVVVRAESGGVTVSIHDEGRGIAPEDQAHLFDRLYQAARARQRKSGLGLGLFIVKGYVDAHHGRIRVDSQLGRGTTFHVWFPSNGGVS